MCPESMAEGMAGKPSGPSQAVFVLMDMPGKEKSINRPGGIRLFWEKLFHRPAAGEPVFRKDI